MLSLQKKENSFGLEESDFEDLPTT